MFVSGFVTPYQKSDTSMYVSERSQITRMTYTFGFTFNIRNTTMEDEYRPSDDSKLDRFKAFASSHIIHARVSVFVASLVAFLTSTALTGTGAGDFTFLLCFVMMLYLSLHHYYVTKNKLIDLAKKYQLVVDGIFALLLFAAVIAIASLYWWRWIVGFFCLVSLIFAAVIQAVLVYALTQNPETSDSPVLQENEYTNDVTPDTRSDDRYSRS
jgi:hypothetical protein